MTYFKASLCHKCVVAISKLNMNSLSHEILIGEGQDPCSNRGDFLGLPYDVLKKENTYSLK